MKRLTEWVGENIAVPDMENHKIGHSDCMKKLADYEDLEEQGLLIKLPCKLGDIVYDLVFCDDGEYRIYKMKVCSIRPYGDINYKENNVWNIYLEDSYSKAYHTFYDVGKTVFFTREEAEEALRKRLEGFK